MASRDFEAATRQYTSALGEFIMAWNHAENTVRWLLMALSGSTSIASHILTAELGSRGLTDGLKAFSPTLEPPIRETVLLVVELYDRLREYRNYYAHGIMTVAVRDGVTLTGWATMASAKGKLGYAEDFVTLAQIMARLEDSRRLSDGARAIIAAVDPGARLEVPLPLPSRETLPLPDRLKKTLRYPLHAPPPPQSSER